MLVIRFAFATKHIHKALLCDQFQVWLKQPLVDLAEITTRHDIVEAFTSDPLLRESLRDQHLRGMLLTLSDQFCRLSCCHGQLRSLKA